MSPPGRPKGEHRSAQHAGSTVTPPGRPKGEHRSAQHAGSTVTPPGRPKGEHRSAQHAGSTAQAPVRAAVAGFAQQLIDWQRQHGRHGMPWQGTRDPYRVWLSEVMLQQTQVDTVLAYYARFLTRFPTVRALAEASADEVLALWAGLGYYSRAHNLHRCAQVVVQQHDGIFPTTAQALQALPGIGASTAAAVAAFCQGERVSILDGNARRVLTRLLAFDGDLAQAASRRSLWTQAQALLPAAATPQDMVAYTQGLMDLGASVCTRSQPRCPHCPVQNLCATRAADTAPGYPLQTRRPQRRHASWWLLLLLSRARAQADRIWLVRRPAAGIWAGLHCPPVFDSEAALRDSLAAPLQRRLRALEPLAHSLTHRQLQLHPVLLDARTLPEPPALCGGQWVSADALSAYGLPAPVRRLLQSLLGGAAAIKRPD